MKKLSALLVVVLLLSTILAACNSSESNDEPGSKKENEKTFITVATGGSGGVFFALGGALADIYKSLDGVIANAQSTKGSVVNVALINDGKADIAFSNSSIAYYASNGIAMFDKKLENVYAMAELYPMYYHLVVAKDSGINSIADIKGKKIAVGEKGSGTEVNVHQFLEGWNITYDDFDESFISFSNAVDQMKNKSIDGAFVGAGIPTSSVMELMTSGNAKLVPLDNETVKKLAEKKYPFFKPGKIPAGTYSGQDEDIETILIGTTLVVRKDLDEELAYKLTKAIYDNLDKLRDTHSAANNIKLESATDGMSIKIHPGAKKYYEENGLKIPTAAQ